MTNYEENVWKDCNCMNCRLARIEDSLKKICYLMNESPNELDNRPEHMPS